MSTLLTSQSPSYIFFCVPNSNVKRIQKKIQRGGEEGGGYRNDGYLRLTGERDGSRHIFWQFYNVILRNLNFPGGSRPPPPQSRFAHACTLQVCHCKMYFFR